MIALCVVSLNSFGSDSKTSNAASVGATVDKAAEYIRLKQLIKDDAQADLDRTFFSNNELFNAMAFYFDPTDESTLLKNTVFFKRHAIMKKMAQKGGADVVNFTTILQPSAGQQTEISALANAIAFQKVKYIRTLCENGGRLKGSLLTRDIIAQLYPKKGPAMAAIIKEFEDKDEKEAEEKRAALKRDENAKKARRKKASKIKKQMRSHPQPPILSATASVTATMASHPSLSVAPSLSAQSSSPHNLQSSGVSIDAKQAGEALSPASPMNHPQSPNAALLTKATGQKLTMPVSPVATSPTNAALIARTRISQKLFSDLGYGGTYSVHEQK